VTSKRPRPKGSGSVYWSAAKRRWVAQLEVRGPDGRRSYRRRFVATKDEAEAALALLRLEPHRPRSAAPMTTGEWLDTWVRDVLPGLAVTPGTAEDYRRYVRRAAPLRAVPLHELSPTHVQRLLADLADQGYSRTVCRLTRAALSRALGEAERRGLISRNLARLAVLPPTAPRPKERRSLTPEQARALEAVLEGEPDEAMWLSMLLLGLRPGEAVALRWCDLDLDQQVLHVAQARKRSPSRPVAGPPKTRRSVRALRMPPALVRAVSRLEPGPPEALAFPTKYGNLRDDRALERRLATLCRRAGIDPPVRPYELRHTAASLLSDAGVPIEVLADLLGHTSTQMLEQVYRHRVRKVVDPGLWT
jgi:integrase